MGKKELVEKISNKMNIQKNLCGKILDELIFSIQDELKKGEEISFYKFGKFSIKEIKEKLMYIPSKSCFIKINRKFLPVFKASKTFKII